MKKILIIDDSKFSRMRVRQFLEQDYFEIIEAENGLVGLELIQTEQPDCILCDILMPEMNGMELLEKLNEKRIKIPVVIITADIQETTKKKALDLGAVALVKKPAEMTKIVNVIYSVFNEQKDK